MLSLKDAAFRVGRKAQKVAEYRTDADAFAALEALELEARRLADDAKKLTDLLRSLPKCCICEQFCMAECPHEECAAEEMESYHNSGTAFITP